ncbi:MAG: 50S ribosomal protein L25 [Candidatus Pelagibacter sp.]|nr:50S ribosomal protein L25 [Candidatus Pelagibacter sp.]OUW24550.1 MAG: 50S ribosomal protein L25/general stress protein Ctc [Rickettsiales bacterium TMED174]
MTNIKAILRNETTSSANKKLRKEGFVPAIIYGGKDPNKKISINKISLKDIIQSDSFLSKVFELEIDGKKERVLPRDISYNVISDEPIHIDFMRVVAGSKVVLEIPVKFINQNDSPGLKRGGVLNIVRRKIELSCPAEKIPNELIVDLTGSDIGTSLKISSVNLGEEIKPTITGRDFVIATVAPPTIIKEPEKPAEETAEGSVEGDSAAVEDADPKTTQAKDGKEPEAKKDDKSKDGSTDKKAQPGEKKTQDKK